MSESLYQILYIIISSILSSGATFFFTRNKYKAEVKNIEVENINKIIDIYKKELDSVNLRIEKYLEKIHKLENKVNDLKQELNLLKK